MITSKIRKELARTDLIDYKFLTQKECLRVYPKLLETLLKEGQKRFEKLIKLEGEEMTFANVIEEYFQMDHGLNVLYGFIQSLNTTNNSEETRRIIENFQPKIVDYANKITLNPEFYTMVKNLSKQKNLSPDQKRSITLILRDMEVAGVHLPEEKRKELKTINKKISAIAEKFENNVIDSRKEFYYVIKDKKALQEMPENSMSAAKKEAESRKMKGDYVFTLSPPSIQAILKYCPDRAIRELFYKKNFTIATSGKFDNRPIILELLELRTKKAHLLGCKNYVEYVLKERMAKSSSEIQALLKKIRGKALKKSKADLKELSTFSGMRELEEWDISYYSEKYSQKNLSIDEKELKKYFPLPEVISGLFKIVEKLFGLKLQEIKVKTYDPSVKVYKVFKNDEPIAYYLADFYARPSKKSGAWCNDLRKGSVSNNGNFLVPIVINAMNFPEGNGKTPALLTHRDVETLFHEFGHAIHVMVSSKGIANLNGFHTEWDFVEFPSQIFENWCWEKEALDLFARHYQTKKTLPKSFITQLQISKTFMSGYKIMRQMEFAMLDLTLHLNQPPKTIKELDVMCHETVNTYTSLKKFDQYSMYTSFDHIFAGGYSAGYYSYMWAEILEADCFQAIKKAGVLKNSTGTKYAKNILGPGAKKAGKELFKDFMGRAPDVNAFMEKHRFIG